MLTFRACSGKNNEDRRNLVSSMANNKLNQLIDVEEKFHLAALRRFESTNKSGSYASKATKILCRRFCNHQALSPPSALMLVYLLFVIALLAGAQADSGSTSAGPRAQQQQLGGKSGHNEQPVTLEAELNSIIQKHDALEDNNKQLAEAIISRLMVNNLNNNEIPITSAGSSDESTLTSAPYLTEPNGDESAYEDTSGSELMSGPTGAEALRMKKLLSLLRNYENVMAAGSGLNGGQAFAAFPELPSGQAATMKRAAMKMGSYLQHQQQRARQSYDFGLGKRPDSGNNVLRYGDSLVAGGVQPVSQFGKRPSAHRFDFGLGKRVASVSI